MAPPLPLQRSATAARTAPRADALSGGRGSIRVLVVDDSLTVRTAFSRMIAGETDLEVVGEAGSGEQALARLEATPADVLLLDLEMPGMGGLAALPRILAAHPGIRVLVISSLTADGAQHSVEALSIGAADTMLKPRPSGFDASYRESLLARIRALGRPASPAAPPARSDSAPAADAAARPLRKPVGALAIGASTGGIHALNLLLRALPADFDLPILVTQHLPQSFMEVFARQLADVSGRETVLADAGTPLAPRRILIAPGTAHMLVRRAGSGLVTALDYDPTPSGCRPSVDPMLSSLAEASEGHAVAAMLSGMGRDGVRGARKLAEAGGTVMAQDAASSAVWGMPRAVVDAGLAGTVAPPETLARAIARLPRRAPWK